MHVYAHIHTDVLPTNRRCIFGDGCAKLPCFGEIGGQAKFCKEHKVRKIIKITQAMCA